MTTSVTDAAAALPSAALRPYVRRYLGYRYRGFTAGLHRGLPSPYLTVVISLAAPTVVTLDAGAPAVGYASLVSGLHTGPAYISHDGSEAGIQLELTPAGSRALLGMPAAALAGTIAELDDLVGADGRELTGRLTDAATWPARFAILDEVLCRRIGPATGPAAAVAHTWRRIAGTGGTARVTELAEETGWSRRHLTSRFAAEFGATPKDAARIVRFDRSRRMLLRPDARSLAEIAAACGYYDQPHLAREWRALAGVPPSVWVASESLPLREDY
jgi:AraC-like DNA-binding protein